MSTTAAAHATAEDNRVSLRALLMEAFESITSVDTGDVRRARQWLQTAGHQLGQDVSESEGRELLSMARRVYNRCIDAVSSSEAEANRLGRQHCTHLRALCLQVIMTCESDQQDDEELASSAKHWGRTACMFLSLNEMNDARACLDVAETVLGAARRSEGDVSVVEAKCMLKGWKAQVMWAYGDTAAVIQQLDQARSLLSLSTPGALLSTRLFVAENVALTLVHVGYISASEDKSGAVDNRQLIRIADSALAILGEQTHDQVVRVRDNALRMKAHLCMLEEEFDAAAMALSQHSVPASNPDENGALRLLKATLLLKTNQKAEACAQLLEWLRSDPTLVFETARNALQLFVEHQCTTAAVEACQLIHERFVADADPIAFKEEYSELCEFKYHLLSQMLQDGAGAADHLEAVIDGHCSGRMAVTVATLSSLGAKLWELGCLSFDNGELHKAIEQYERCARFMEEAQDIAGYHRVLASLGHCYLLQDQPERAASRASAVLSSTLDSERELQHQTGPADTDSGSSMRSAMTVARSVLIKASIKLKDLETARAQADALLTQTGNDYVLLAAICEEVNAMGEQYADAVVVLCEQLLLALDAQRSSAEDRKKLAATTRSLLLLRMRNSATALGGATDGSTEGMQVDKEDAAERGVEQTAPLLKHLQLVAKRLLQEGVTSVCDDPAHLVWLSDQAYNLATKSSGQHSGQRASAAALQLTCDLLQASLDIGSVLALDQKRYMVQLMSYLWLTRCCLKLVAFHPANEGEPNPQTLLARAANSIQTAFRVHQKLAAASVSSGRAANSAGTAHHYRGDNTCGDSTDSEIEDFALDSRLDAHMALLNVEVALRRNDPNARSILQRACEANGVTPKVVFRMAMIAKECSNQALARAALEHAFQALLQAEQKDFEAISGVLRAQTGLLREDSARRSQYRSVMQLLSDFAASNCPMDVDQLYWLLASSWNYGLTAFRERRLEEAEEWLSMSYFFSGLSTDLVERREKMRDMYQKLLAELDPSTNPKAASFQQRLNAQIFPGAALASSEQRQQAASRKRSLALAMAPPRQP